MVLPTVWGPKLWMILHRIGWKAGKSALPVRRDEERELKWIIEHLEYIVPCPECRQHIDAYRKEKGLPRSAWEVGKWFWVFHNEVNTRLGKGTIEWSEDLGKEGTALESWEVYKNTIKESLLKGALRQSDVNDFGRHLRMWAGFCA